MDMRIAAYAVIVRDGEILLSHWVVGERGAWTLPGGGIDPGEHPADAAVREVHEETGYHAALGALLGVDSLVLSADQRLTGPARPLHGIRIVYEASIVGGELTHEVDGSSDEARWFPLAELDVLQRVSLVDIGVAWWRERGGA
jgi:8-oxo-dGTP pyrophosphatase MutT (NUDIX family)